MSARTSQADFVAAVAALSTAAVNWLASPNQDQTLNILRNGVKVAKVFYVMNAIPGKPSCPVSQFGFATDASDGDLVLVYDPTGLTCTASAETFLNGLTNLTKPFGL